MITVVGLGCSPLDLTLIGRKTIKKAEAVYVRTFLTKSGKNVKKLFPSAESFDSLYEQAADFDELCSGIVSRLSPLDNAVYCVDGGGADDATVVALCKCCEVNIIAGVSAQSSALRFSPSARAAVISATAVCLDKLFFAPDYTLVVDEVDDRCLAGELKLRLLEAYGERSCVFIRGDISSTIMLSELDRQKQYGYSCKVVLPSDIYYQKSRFNFDDLMRIILRLRQPDGCPWDRVQTHKSIRGCCIEEAYELVEAIDLQDIDKMTEECGDVLIQALFHSTIAEACGEFSTTDVISGVCAKLIGRHAHIFGTETATDDKEALTVWENAKAKEKSQDTYSERMRQVAKSLPALTTAYKYQRIAAKSGLDYANAEECKAELRSILTAESWDEELCGRALFALVNIARTYGQEPELALLEAAKRFEKNYEVLELRLAQEGKKPCELSREQLFALYNEVKNANRS